MVKFGKMYSLKQVNYSDAVSDKLITVCKGAVILSIFRSLA